MKLLHFTIFAFVMALVGTKLNASRYHEMMQEADSFYQSLKQIKKEADEIYRDYSGNKLPITLSKEKLDLLFAENDYYEELKTLTTLEGEGDFHHNFLTKLGKFPELMYTEEKFSVLQSIRSSIKSFQISALIEIVLARSFLARKTLCRKIIELKNRIESEDYNEGSQLLKNVQHY